MAEPDEKRSNVSLVVAQANQSEQEKLEKLRARLAAGEASSLVEDFDPDQFLEEMHQKYGRD